MPRTLDTGVWGVVVTPFTGSNFDLDEMSLARLVEHYTSIGVTGLTVLGVFGEAASLSDEERVAVLETVVDITDLPIVVGATSLSTSRVIEEVERVQAVVGDRLAGAMIQVNSGNAEVLSQHLRAVHQATGAGIVVQDYPLVSHVPITASALISAITAVDGVVAVKAEAPPTPPAIADMTAAVDVPVFGGLGGIGLLDELACGSGGAMTGFSFPEALISTIAAFESGGFDAARDAFTPFLPLVNFEQQAKIALAIRKECLRQRGLILDSVVRPPSASLPDSLLPQLKKHLETIPHPTAVA